MLSKSLIQLSVDGRGCVPALLFDLRPNYGRGNEDKGTSFKRSHAHTATLSALTLQWPLLTHASAGDSWTLMGKSASVSCGINGSFLLGPGAHKVLFVPSKSLFPQSCVSSGGSMVGLTATSLCLCYTQVYCTQSPCPCSSPLLTCTSSEDNQIQFCLNLYGVSGS